MTTAPNVADPPLRLWPGLTLAALLVLAAYVLPYAGPAYGGATGMIAAVAGALLILVWWLIASRARWYERVGAIVLLAAAAAAQRFAVHASIAGGAMGFMSYMVSIPTLSVALVGWAWLRDRLAAGPRLAAALVCAVLGCVPWMLVRTAGMSGGGTADLHWRWTPTPEERLLAQEHEAPAPIPDAPAAAAPAAQPASTGPAATIAAPPPPVPTKAAEWPGFRGPARDSVVHGVAIATDWAATPPVQLWRHGVGPGWSSFAVRGDRLYTQEQRGEDEVVSCYRVSTGATVWRHRDHVRFWESNGGAGPRGTPTLKDGRVYTLGATGILNSLDESSGAVVWSRNLSADAKVKVPMWGFASSPLVVGDLVIVAASGKLAAFDVISGEPRWLAPSVGGSYSSPHLATIDGVAQVVLLGAGGATAVAPATGTRLWDAKWESSVTIVQPSVIGDRDILITTAAATGGEGVRRLALEHGGGTWTARERWTSNGLKPYFNDYVIHDGYAYGFDGSILSCIDLEDGARKWKGGRYGNGQIVLLAEQGLLLVTTEDGELALVKAQPDQFTEVARVPALEGKTWNHPVLVRDTLLVRNDHEMAAFRLPVVKR
jgi:outer membrane protein assembly factor BamB